MGVFTKEVIDEFRVRFGEMTKKFEVEYGIKLSFAEGSDITFGEDQFAAMIVGTPSEIREEIHEEKKKEDVVGNHIYRLARAEGFTVDISEKGFVGTIYKIPGKRFPHTITGINDNCPKYKINCSVPSGTQYKCPVSMLKGATIVGHI